MPKKKKVIVLSEWVDWELYTKLFTDEAKFVAEMRALLAEYHGKDDISDADIERVKAAQDSAIEALFEELLQDLDGVSYYIDRQEIDLEEPAPVDPEEEARRVKIVALAKSEEGTIEIDKNAEVSEGDDNGAYVQAWVWVSFHGTDLDKDNEVESED